MSPITWLITETNTVSMTGTSVKKSSLQAKHVQKATKQKWGIVRHLKNVHRGKSFGSAKLEIIDRKDLKYMIKEEYTQKHQVRDMAVDEVARLVEMYGEEVCVE